MVANMLSLNISKSDFTVAHRLQQTKESQGDDKRPIIAKICRRYVKCTTLTAGPKKKAEKLLRRWESNSGSKDYFAHPTSNEKGSFKYRQGNDCVWRKGFSFRQPSEPASGNAQDLRHLISNQDSRKKFCDEYIKVPLETFLRTDQ